MPIGNLRHLILCSMFATAMMALPSTATAAIGVMTPLHETVAASDVILVGEVADVAQDGSPESGSLLLIPIAVLKGTPAAGPVRIGIGRPANSGSAKMAGRRSLAFASRDAAGSLRLVPIALGDEVPLDDLLFTSERSVPGPLLGTSPSDSPLQLVIKELATIQAYSKSTTALYYLLQLAWQGVEEDTLRVAFEALRATPDGFAHGTLGLAALGGVEGIVALDEALAMGIDDVRQGLQYIAIDFESTDPRALGILQQWLDSNAPDMREAAAAGLARIHTPAAVCLLGPALDHFDHQVRWRAIGGLAMFANNVPVGGAGPAEGYAPFSSDDTFRYSVYDDEIVAKDPSYLAFWRVWWQKHADAIRELAK